MTIRTRGEREHLLKTKRTWKGIVVDKQKNGEPTEDEIVTVFVREKKPKKKLRWADTVPQRIDGRRTDVEEIGEVVACGRVNLDSRLRPVRLGSSVMNVKGEGKGSQGPVFRDEPFKDKFYGGSNAHVYLADIAKGLKDQPSLVIIQPGWKPALRTSEIGDVVKATKIPLDGTITRDSAIMEYRKAEDVDPSIPGFGIPKRVRIPKVGETGRLVSWRKRATGKKRFENVTLEVRYVGGERTVHGCSIYERMSSGGTSGTLITDENCEEYWELNFAGSPNATIAIPFSNSFDTYGKVPVLEEWWVEYKKQEESPGLIQILLKLWKELVEFINKLFKK